MCPDVDSLEQLLLTGYRRWWIAQQRRAYFHRDTGAVYEPAQALASKGSYPLADRADSSVGDVGPKRAANTNRWLYVRMFDRPGAPVSGRRKRGAPVIP